MGPRLKPVFVRKYVWIQQRQPSLSPFPAFRSIFSLMPSCLTNVQYIYKQANHQCMKTLFCRLLDQTNKPKCHKPDYLPDCLFGYFDVTTTINTINCTLTAVHVIPN